MKQKNTSKTALGSGIGGDRGDFHCIDVGEAPLLEGKIDKDLAKLVGPHARDDGKLIVIGVVPPSAPMLLPEVCSSTA